MSPRLKTALGLSVLVHAAFLIVPLARRGDAHADARPTALAVRLVPASADPDRRVADAVPPPPPAQTASVPPEAAPAVDARPLLARPAQHATVPKPRRKPMRPAHAHAAPPRRQAGDASAQAKPQPPAAAVVQRVLETAPEGGAATRASAMPPGDPAGVAEAPPPPLVPPLFGLAYLANPKPVYPLAARRRGLEGRVVLRVRVSVEGRPVSTAVAHSSGHDLLDGAAVDAVRQWRFVPAHRGSEPVEAFALVPIRFSLRS
ncbi:energy transducer TonB [Nitrogeniibacter mangrovi]|uniref:Energy transducer TonB n=1 Tax=Nitrogeniibacter mangrovi TaxID=2016596 RepID=A0A6C1B0F6_9RHOO|nr:energy transducer TonB [Nitrogeniibacter mangrovi]QID17047.1 energy transducer TonB [Nitrogeniibacter mangrovi]